MDDTNSRTNDNPQVPLPQARILGIETSCDETAAAVVENGNIIHSNIVASQVDLHAQFGGVFPEVASRQHIRTIHNVIDLALKEAHLNIDEVDALAVTRGPGLPGSLVVGVNVAKGLAMGGRIPLLGINHLEAHIYSAWLDWPPSGEARPNSTHSDSGEGSLHEPRFPLLVLIVSGGHTELVLMSDHLTYQRLGGTLDDAAGEAFDKVGRLLGLDYPGGPAIEKAALNGDPQAFNFPRAKLEGTWNFSFSGLKTAVLREVKWQEKHTGSVFRSELPVPNMAASFQAAVVDVLVEKTLLAAKTFNVGEILIAGGVSANQALRDTFLEQSAWPVYIPPLALCTDNAAMIASAGYYRYATGQRDSLDMDVLPNWPISEL